MQESWTVAIVTPTAGIETSRTERVAELFDRHQERLYRLARRLSPDPEAARDLLQDTFLRVARRPGGVPQGAVAEEAWLVRILVNLSRDRHRRLVVRERARSSLGTGQTNPSHPESAAVARLTVQRALSRLSPRRRSMVVLHELEGMPVSRIAEVLGTARVTVRWHLSQARRELAGWLVPAPKPSLKEEGPEGSHR